MFSDDEDQIPDFTGRDKRILCTQSGGRGGGCKYSAVPGRTRCLACLVRNTADARASRARRGRAVPEDMIEIVRDAHLAGVQTSALAAALGTSRRAISYAARRAPRE